MLKISFRRGPSCSPDHPGTWFSILLFVPEVCGVFKGTASDRPRGPVDTGWVVRKHC